MLITNFASGELSPNLNGRVDLRQYYQGAAHIENFEIIPTGGIKRRPGTRRLAQLDGESRIIPFIVDKNSVYILQFIVNPNYDPQTEGSVPSYIKVWQKGVTDQYSVIETLDAPYTSLAEIKEIQYAQNYDTLILVHKDYRPQEIVKGISSFTITPMTFDFGADVELDNDYDTKDYQVVMTPKPGTSKPVKGTSTDGNVMFTYSIDVDGVTTTKTSTYPDTITDYWCIYDGKLWKYIVSDWQPYGDDPLIDKDLFTTANKYPGAVAFFNNRLFFASTRNNPQMVWGSAAPDSYGTRYKHFCTYKKFVTVNKVVKDADLHIFSCNLLATNIDTTNHRTTFTSVTQNFTTEAGLLKTDITNYYVSSDILPVGTKVVSCTTNTITVDTDQVAVVWEEEESEKDNLVMSIQLWRSVDSVSAEDYEFTVVSNNITTADCSMFFEIASDQCDAIMFMSSNRFLAIGTESSIWSVDPGISALNINAVMQGRYGSDDIQGQAVETATVYFAQGKKGIREFYWDGESNAFKTNNIAILADHILRESAAEDFDYMTNPFSKLLIVRADGTVAQMTYDKTNGIMAWSRIIHGGGIVKNIAVTRGSDENDLIFMVTKDGDNYYLELLDMESNLLLYSVVYLDSWSRYNPNSLNPTAGYDTTKALLYNFDTGETCPANNIPQGFIGEQDIVYIGYQYTSLIKSMPVVNNDPSGKKRIVALQVRFVNSYLPIVYFDDKPEEHFTTVQEVPYSGVAKVNYPGVTDRDVHFVLKAFEPKPVNILSVDAQTS